ncbi:MAG: peptidoglycan-binding protein [Chthoniobacterales bacterium]|jgi:Putative peptidoglycan binding domain
MKMTKALTMIFAVAGLLAFAVPTEAQSHGNRGGNWNGNSHQGNWNHGNWNHGHGNWHGGYGYYNGSRVNFYFGGFGYPFYFGYPYWGGYPYYGYPYGYYGSPPVGAYYTYDPRGVYQGRVVSGAAGRGSLAAQVQQQLAAAGYYHGEIDGIVGDGTRRAIRNYERANGMPVNGEINDQLLSAMGLG